MSVEFDTGSPGKFDSRTLNRETLNRWTGRGNDTLPLSREHSESTFKIRFLIVLL